MDTEHAAEHPMGVGVEARELARRRLQDPTYRGGDDTPIGSCPRCGTAVRWSGRGRKPRWCSQTCRQRAKEARRTARNNEQPLSVIDGPAAPHNAQAWVDRLIDPAHRQLFAAVLRGLNHQLDTGTRAFLPHDAERFIEKALDLPAGTIAQLRPTKYRPPTTPHPASGTTSMPGPDHTRIGIDTVERYIDAATARINAHGVRAGADDYPRILLAAERMVEAKQRAQHHDTIYDPTNHTPPPTPDTGSTPTPKTPETTEMSRRQRRAAQRAATKNK